MEVIHISNIGTYAHLSIEDRKTIESLLNTRKTSRKTIADIIGCSQKCVGCENKYHRKIRTRTSQHNKCDRQLYCSIQKLCTLYPSF